MSTRADASVIVYGAGKGRISPSTKANRPFTPNGVATRHEEWIVQLLLLALPGFGEHARRMDWGYRSHTEEPHLHWHAIEVEEGFAIALEYATEALGLARSALGTSV